MAQANRFVPASHEVRRASWLRGRPSAGHGLGVGFWVAPAHPHSSDHPHRFCVGTGRGPAFASPPPRAADSLPVPHGKRSLSQRQASMTASGPEIPPPGLCALHMQGCAGRSPTDLPVVGVGIGLGDWRLPDAECGRPPVQQRLYDPGSPLSKKGGMHGRQLRHRGLGSSAKRGPRGGTREPCDLLRDCGGRACVGVFM